MKKQLIIVGIIVLLVCVGLSGCTNQTSESNSENNANIVTPTITSFNINPNTINIGETATLSWVVTNATNVSINNGIGIVALSGNQSISPTVRTVYVITASNSGKQEIAVTSINVIRPGSQKLIGNWTYVSGYEKPQEGSKIIFKSDGTAEWCTGFHDSNLYQSYYIENNMLCLSYGAPAIWKYYYNLTDDNNTITLTSYDFPDRTYVFRRE